MANAETIQSAIAPGSTPYGERSQLEGAVSSAVQQSGGAQANPTTGKVGLGGPMDPKARLLGGGIPVEPDPLTSGLSVGPGPGPTAQPPQHLDLQRRLLYVAEFAKTPHLRAQARFALRRLVRTRKVEE